MSLPRCDVIVPTQARGERAALLREALQSILDQTGVQARPIVVLNGGGSDPALRDELGRDSRLRVRVVAEPGLPNALRVGRRMVDTPWFATLDDDDVLLPGALAARLAAFTEHPETDVVISNGYRQEASGNVLHVRAAAPVARDPLLALISANWLLPGSWLGRSATVPLNVFDGMPEHLEQTYLALRFASGYRMRFLATPTVIWRTLTPDSVSKSRAFRLGQVPALRRLLGLPLPPVVRHGFERHLTAAWHAEADLHLAEGAWHEAWRCHTASLRGRGGWRYLPYSFALLRARPGR